MASISGHPAVVFSQLVIAKYRITRPCTAAAFPSNLNGDRRHTLNRQMSNRWKLYVGILQYSERGRGGGIHVTGAVPLYLGDLILRENEAQTGGGIFVVGSGDLLIERCSAINNVASSSGGGLIANRIGTVRQSTFSGNSATDRWCNFSESLAIEYSTIVNNLATGNRRRNKFLQRNPQRRSIHHRRQLRSHPKQGHWPGDEYPGGCKL